MPNRRAQTDTAIGRDDARHDVRWAADAAPPAGGRRALDDYLTLWNRSEYQEDAARSEVQPQLVSRFYDAVSRFYEFG